jgi:hypothetical protein
MSWLKEVEESLTKKIEADKEREESERFAKEMALERRKRDWENDDRLPRVLKRWEDWGCDDILEEVRRVVWPNCLLSGKDIRIETIEADRLDTKEYRLSPIFEKEEVRKRKGIFGGVDITYETTDRQAGWEIEASNWEERERIRWMDKISEDVNELLARIGLIPSGTEVFVEAEIYDTWYERASHSESEDSSGTTTLLTLTLFDSHISIGSQRFSIEEIKSASGLKSKFIQVLKRRLDLKDRLP